MDTEAVHNAIFIALHIMALHIIIEKNSRKWMLNDIY